MGDFQGHPFAEAVRRELATSGSPEARVIAYGRGYAVQHNKSGTYYPEPRGHGKFSGPTAHEKEVSQERIRRATTRKRLRGSF